MALHWKPSSEFSCGHTFWKPPSCYRLMVCSISFILFYHLLYIPRVSCYSFVWLMNWVLCYIIRVKKNVGQLWFRNVLQFCCWGSFVDRLIKSNINLLTKEYIERSIMFVGQLTDHVAYNCLSLSTSRIPFSHSPCPCCLASLPFVFISFYPFYTLWKIHFICSCFTTRITEKRKKKHFKAHCQCFVVCGIYYSLSVPLHRDLWLLSV